MICCFSNLVIKHKNKKHKTILVKLMAPVTGAISRLCIMPHLNLLPGLFLMTGR